MSTHDAAGPSGVFEDPTVTIVLPCLNEAASIVACIEEARSGLQQAGLTGEVLVVDNGSTDGSMELALGAGARVVCESVRGYGSALRRGIEDALGEVVVMADADLTYDLSRLGELTGPVLDGSADLMLGARLDGANHGTMPFLHRFVGTPAISFLLRRACGGLSVRDSQSGYRAFNASKIRALHLKATGMEFASEMLIRASQEGLGIGEKSIGYRPRVGDSKLDTFTDGWRHLQLILLLAPQLLVLWPGALLLSLGIALSVASIFNPYGFELGSLLWQPIFFAPILVVLGSAAVLSGVVLAHHSPLVTNGEARRYEFVGSERFSGRCVTGGSAALAAGVAIDIVLLGVWLQGGPAPEYVLAFAGLAQSLILSGAITASFGFVYRILVRQIGYRREAGGVDILHFGLAESLTLMEDARRSNADL